MKIEKFRVNGFKTSGRYAEVEFSADNVTVIYGENGSGKTTFLRALFAFLSQDDRALNLLQIESIQCLITNTNGLQEVIVSQIDETEDYDWSDFNAYNLNGLSSLSLGVDRGISTQPLRVDASDIYQFISHPKRRDMFNYSNRGPVASGSRYLREFSEELSFFLRRKTVSTRSRRTEIDYDDAHVYLQSIKIENIEELLCRRYRAAKISATKRIQSALFDTLSVAIDSDQQMPAKRVNYKGFKERLLKNRDRMIEALEAGEENNFKYRIISELESIGDAEDISRIENNALLSRLFFNVIEELEIETFMLSSINFLVDTFNNYLIEGKKLVVTESEVFIEIGANAHSVNDLSSGERHILTFLTLVLFVGQDRDFLIIDEPEISLNITWQRELMSLFSELLPHTQIIVASHSPALAKRNPQFLKELSVWRD